MELCERMEQAVARKVSEETGLVVRMKRLVGIYASRSAFEHIDPNGDQMVIVTILFDCQVAGGTLCADNEESRGR